MKAGVILNPVAGGGGLVRKRAALEAALASRFAAWDIRLTQEPGDGGHLAMAFAAGGCDVVIAAGGDGTGSEVAEGLIQARRERGAAPALALVPCGTGADFARGLELPRDIEAALSRITAATPRVVDAGRATYVDDHGALASRHFVNIASAGISAPVSRAVNRDKRKGRASARALFYWRTVLAFMTYRFQDVRLTVDEAAPIEARVALVAVCNGRFFGGGMMIAPDAALDDGKLDVVVVRAAGKLGLIRDLRLLYGGRHLNHPAVTVLRGSRVAIEPAGDPGPGGIQVEADGEALGCCPATFEALPGALTLKM